MADEADVARFGVGYDPENYAYDVNSCGTCGQPVLIVASKERAEGYRTEQTACEYCMSKLGKRTRAKRFKWVFLQGWKPEG
ncbi:MAG TPA: hypothetical protein VGK74_19915 [Symbiobacteriaceae bacterium]